MIFIHNYIVPIVFLSFWSEYLQVKELLINLCSGFKLEIVASFTIAIQML